MIYKDLLCEHCGTIFKGVTSKYCSNICRDRARYPLRKEQQKITLKKYREKNKEKLQEYYDKNRSKRRHNSKQWKNDNKERVKEYRKQWYEINKFKRGIGRSIHGAINSSHNYKLFNYLPYTKDELIKYLLKTVSENYTFEQWKKDKLHIDHIIPQKYFIFDDYNDEFRKCWNLRNLRLVDSNINNIKNDKIDIELIKKYDIMDLIPDKYKEIVNERII